MNFEELLTLAVLRLERMATRLRANVANPWQSANPCRIRYVIVRSRGAGVFFAKILRERPTEVDVVESRHIWSWTGALTVSDIAANGVTSAKISAPVTQTIAEKLEVIDCSDKASRQLLELVSP